MFIFLSKFLPPLVYPLGLVFVLIAAGLFLYRRPRAQRLVLIAALLLLWVFSTPWMSTLIVRSLEWRYLPMAETPEAEAIVLLGGGTDSQLAPRPMVEVNGAGDRVLYAAYLYHQGKAEYILVTGGSIDWLSNGDAPAEDMAVLLEMLGVPRQALWLETQSRNTYENTIYSRQILEQKGVHKVLLVTSAQHMPRSVALFAHAEAQQPLGLEVIPTPTDFSVTGSEGDGVSHPGALSHLINLVPSASNLAQVTSALKEYLGILIYWLRGWL